MQLSALVGLFPDLDEVEITSWVARGWVRPDAAGGAEAYAEIDVARVRLIRDLRRDMDVPEDTVALVLSLIDQIHALRGALHAVHRALETQPPPVLDAVRAALARQGAAAPGKETGP